VTESGRATATGAKELLARKALSVEIAM